MCSIFRNISKANSRMDLVVKTCYICGWYLAVLSAIYGICVISVSKLNSSEFSDELLIEKLTYYSYAPVHMVDKYLFLIDTGLIIILNMISSLALLSRSKYMLCFVITILFTNLITIVVFMSVFYLNVSNTGVQLFEKISKLLYYRHRHVLSLLEKEFDCEFYPSIEIVEFNYVDHVQKTNCYEVLYNKTIRVRLLFGYLSMNFISLYSKIDAVPYLKYSSCQCSLNIEKNGHFLKSTLEPVEISTEHIPNEKFNRIIKKSDSKNYIISILNFYQDLKNFNYLNLKLVQNKTQYKNKIHALHTFANKEFSFILRRILLGDIKFNLKASFIFPNDMSIRRIGQLNKLQQLAVKTAMLSPLTQIQGPPGTGKNLTSATIICNLNCYLLAIFVCAPSNAAVNNLADKLDQAGFSVIRLFLKQSI
ncbi:hypothetical protein A3Q56_05474 [Intoshia linei]|uniref:DNA2/NAM7 helicase helicase domain-containing protein n=1 Tax=Intoshia linei TaxID=1819745 RepID=A0A177AZL6_9BILA|nr:hypothetical protein A3Q56_05474 [Intoshia linei]